MFSQLKGFTNFMHKVYFELGWSFHNTLVLHCFQPLYFGMTNMFVPYVNANCNACAMWKHCGTQFRHSYIQDKHPTIYVLCLFILNPSKAPLAPPTSRVSSTTSIIMLNCYTLWHSSTSCVYHFYGTSWVIKQVQCKRNDSPWAKWMKGKN